ncbi:MAG: sugar transferase [Anaerolineae bacterium]|nr:sugar transferase [Anaerolineae bacterium]
MAADVQILRIRQGAWKRRERFAPAFRLALPFSERRALLIAGDALLVNLAVLAAMWLWAWIDGQAFTSDFVRARWFWFPLLAGAWWCLARLLDLYDIPVASRRFEVAWRIALVGLGLVLGYLLVYFVSPRNALPRLFFLFFSGITLVGTLLWRWTYASVFAMPAFRRRVLIVGAGWSGRALARVLSGGDTTDYRVVGFVDDDPAKQNTRVVGLPVLGNSADLAALARAHRVDEVVVDVAHELGQTLFQALIDCRTIGIHVARMPDLYEQLTRRVPVEHVDAGWVLDALNGFTALGHLEQAAKRLLDLACGLVGLIGLAFLLPFVALAICLDDGGPVFYTQVRSGLGGDLFRLFKFRTMRSDAEDGQAQWAQENDDRVTRVGRFLRKTRLDESPQVINVLRGEMSIVGPRPERPEFITDLETRVPFYSTRLVVKPGITGWGQVHYRYGNSVKDTLIKLQYDLYYIRHWSLWLDLYVIFKTAGVVLGCKGT